MTRPLIVGTRRSRLAQIQTEQVLVSLRDAWPELEIHTKYIATSGDRSMGALRDMGKGAFTGALEQELVAGQIDIAVHSLKDLPTELHQGLMLGAILMRATARDVLISNHGWMLDELPPDAVIGTSSVRRRAQLRAWRSGVRVVPIRGNVDTRIRKMQDGEVDALVLAEAGLSRLCVKEVSYTFIPLDVMLPAPGQGALAVECREADTATVRLLKAIDSADDRRATEAERSFLNAMGGGCAAPVAAYARTEGDSLVMDGAVMAPNGSAVIRVMGRDTSATELGETLARIACGRGARKLMHDA